MLLILIILTGCGEMFGGNKTHERSKFYLYAMNPDGSDKDKICKLGNLEGDALFGDFLSFFRVSPDAKYLSGWFGYDDFKVIELETGEVVVHNSIEERSIYPEFSADSKYVTFAKNSYLYLLNLETEQESETFYEDLGEFPFFADDTHLIFSRRSINSNQIQVISKNINSGANEILYSFNQDRKLNHIRIKDGSLYLLNVSSYSGAIRKVDLNTGQYFDSNYWLGNQPFEISPGGDKIVGTSTSNYMLRVISTDGMDYNDIYRGGNGVFINNSDIVFEDEGKVRVGRFDGSGDSKLTSNFPFYYNTTQNKIYYIKEKKIYE